MPRLLSVAKTEAAVVARRKTVSRRAGWTFLKAGDRLTLVRKAMGRRPGEPLVRLVDVEVVDVRRELLQDITADDVAREGFPEWTRDQFLDFFCDEMGGTGLQEVTRIEWRYAEPIHETIAAAIHGCRFLYGAEKALQHGLHQALTRAGLLVEAEVSLNPSGRIDFLVHPDHLSGRHEATGIEVKVNGSAETVVRQLTRYSPHVAELVLVTTRSTHLQVPRAIAGKPCHVVLIRGAAW